MGSRVKSKCQVFFFCLNSQGQGRLRCSSGLRVSTCVRFSSRVQSVNISFRHKLNGETGAKNVPPIRTSFSHECLQRAEHLEVTMLDGSLSSPSAHWPPPALSVENQAASGLDGKNAPFSLPNPDPDLNPNPVSRLNLACFEDLKARKHVLLLGIVLLFTINSKCVCGFGRKLGQLCLNSSTAVHQLQTNNSYGYGVQAVVFLASSNRNLWLLLLSRMATCVTAHKQLICSH